MNVSNSHQWPFWWRIGILVNVSFYNLLGNAFAAGVSPLFALMIADLHCTFVQAGRLASYALLTLGLSNLIAIPGSSLLSKRHLVLLSQVIFLACNIWAAKAQSYNSLLGTRIVGGLAAGVIEALGPVFIVETFVEKQLSRSLVVYTAMLALGSGFGPLFAGLIAAHLDGWRWFFWILAIATGVNLVGCILMLPETSDEYLLDHTEDAVPDIVKEDVKDAAQLVESVGSAGNLESADPSSTEEIRWYRVWMKNSFYIPKPKWPHGNVFRVSWDFIILLFMPPVTMTMLIYGVSIGWFVVITTVIAAVFESPPYLWDSESMGIFGLSSIVGIIVGIPFGGHVSDYLSRRSARRNDGVHHAESRLPAIILPFVVSPLGILICGIYLQRGEIWVPEAFGAGMLGFGSTSAATTMLSYAVDSFPHRTGEISLMVNVVKNIIGFGLSYGAISWWQAEGALNQFGTMAGLLWAVYLPVFPLYFYGRRLRGWATNVVKV